MIQLKRRERHAPQESLGSNDSSQNTNTKSCLLRTAIRLFASRGYDGTTVKDLANEAGVNVSLISYHYLGKEGLYRACLQECGRERLAVTQKLLRPAVTPEEFRIRLTLFIQEMLDFASKNPNQVRMILREIESDTSTHEDLIRETFLKVFVQLVEFIKAGQKAGIISKEPDPLLVSGMIQGQFSHWVRTDSFRKRYYKLSLQDPQFRETLTQQLVSVFLNGLLLQKNGV